MKIKTIKKVLSAKFASFVDSITDANVRQLVKENSIITGGSIASMLLGENVNDYDIYFTNKLTVLAVAKYYVEKFQESDDDGYKITIEDENPDDPERGRVKIRVKSAGVASPEEAQESAEYADPDLQQAKELTGIDLESKAEEKKEDDSKKYRPAYLSDNAITLTHKVQLIIRFYGEPEEIHENYDFIHAMNYWRSKGGELTTKKEALEALLARTLTYKGSKYPVASVLRAKKFIQRGWNINAGQYLKMMFQISELDLKNVEVLREQLTGMDMVYMNSILAKVEADKLANPDMEIDNTYFATIVERVFG